MTQSWVLSSLLVPLENMKKKPSLQTSLPFVCQRSRSGRTGPFTTPVLCLGHDGKAVIWGNHAAAAGHRRAACTLKAQAKLTP